MRSAATTLSRHCRPLAALALALVALAGCRAPGPPAASTPAAPAEAAAAPAEALPPERAGAPAVVERVVDGDTLDVHVAGREDRVRLIGIDTPETKKPDSPVECFGPEAADHLASLLREGSEVRLLGDVEARDAYDRLLAYAFLPDGRFLNLVMVAEGYATTLRIEPNTAFASELGTAEAAAAKARLGLWAACPQQR